MTIKEILEQVALSRDCTQPEKGMDIDIALASIRSVLLEELPKSFGEDAKYADKFQVIGYNQALSEAREVIERITR